MNTQRLTILEKVGFGSGDLAVNVVISSMFLIINYFYTDIFGLKPEALIPLFIIVRVIDAITDPLMGIVTDKVTTRFGRYRPYFLYLAVPFGISVVLTFTTPDLDYNGKLVWAYATYIFVTLMFTAVTIPYISLIGVLTDSPKEKLSANGYRLFFAKVGAFLVAIAVPALAKIWGAGDLGRGYQLAMALMAGISAVLFLFCFATTTERVEYKVDKKPVTEHFKLLVRNDQWLVLAGVCIVGTVGYVIRSSVAAYYAQYYLGSADYIASFLGTGVAASIIAMVASTWYTKRFCKINLFRYSQIAAALVSVVLFFGVGPGDVKLAYVLYFLLMFFVDIHAPVFWSAIAEAVDYGEAKSGQRASGLAFGLISFCQKFGMGIAGGITNWLLAYFGYQAGIIQSEFTLLGLALLFTIIPGAFSILMGGLMFRYRITDTYYNRMKKGDIPGLNRVEALAQDTSVS